MDERFEEVLAEIERMGYIIKYRSDSMFHADVISEIEGRIGGIQEILEEIELECG